MILDAGRSFDPDKTSEEETFEWELADESGQPVFIETPDGRQQPVVIPNGKRVPITVRQFFPTAGRSVILSLSHRLPILNVPSTMLHGKYPVDKGFRSSSQYYTYAFYHRK